MKHGRKGSCDNYIDDDDYFYNGIKQFSCPLHPFFVLARDIVDSRADQMFAVSSKSTTPAPISHQ